VKEAVYWLDTVPTPATPGEHSELPERADVVVIGAGYTGLSAARRLAKSGATVLVVESKHIGFGASSRNAGQVLTGLRLAPATLIARYGESQARRLFESSLAALDHLEALIAAESIDCEYERTGHIQAAWKAAHFAALRKEQSILSRVFSHHVELVSKDEQRREIGSDRYHGVLVDQRSGALNPAQYVNGLANAARGAGAAIATGINVERLSRGADNAWTLTTPSGPVQARDVLVATDAYTGAATPMLQRGMVAIGSYSVATEPLAEADASRLLPNRRMAYDSKQFLYYFRLTGDRRLLFGGRASFTQSNEQTTRRAAAILRRGINTVFPELADTPIAYAWGGQVSMARDQRPHAGRLPDGTFFAGAYAGHGIAMATLLGDLTARRLAGECVNHPFMDDRCPPIPFYNGTPWFLPVVGAYYQVKDWIS
jgi:glycine/D-amino acid oxidase-like deaminating enzyme